MKDTDTATADTSPPERHSFRLNGRSVVLDRRVHAVRADLADLSLSGLIFSAHYARAVEMTCVLAGAMVLETDRPGARASTQLLRGESFHALDVTTEWTWFAAASGIATPADLASSRLNESCSMKMPRARTTS